MISPLPFDSELFGYPVGKAEITENWNEKEFLEEATNYQLVYIFSENHLPIINSSIQLIETRFVFEKELIEKTEADPEIKKFDGLLNSKLESLAFQSGTFSRFKIDARLKSNEFEKLYKLWIQKSLEEKGVLLADDNAGFVSCSIKSNLAQIGLIAVEETLRGKRWGQRLIHAAENFALAQGATKMKIGTQDVNQPACALYDKLGYKVGERVKVWHYWKGRDL